jgi:putative Ca2+/H+ antiporter (TMEM165/GDT1 family)
MKQLSKWAFQHKFQAQSLIAVGCTVLYTFAVFLGYALLGAEMKCPFYVFEALGVLTFIVSLMYPSKYATDDRNTLTHWYVKTRGYHFLMFFLTALLFCSGGNYVGQWATKPIENTQISTVFSDISFGNNNLEVEKSTQLENLKKRFSSKIPSIKTHIRKNIVRSTHFFGTKKKERSYQQYFLYFSLLVVASWLLAILACNAVCSGLGFAALILVPAALTSSIFAIVFLLKAFIKLGKRREQSEQNLPTN